MTPEAAARRRLASDLDVVAYLRTLPPALRDRALAALGDENVRALDGAWPVWAHDGQLPPAAQADGAPWSTWVIKAGRGFGKTLAGAQWVTAAVAGGERLNIALVGASLDDARRVMVEGRSGLLRVAAPWVRDWQPSFRRLRFITGAEATLFSGASPDLLRGPEHHLAWCDELAKWPRAQECWDMLQLGLRLPHPGSGERPRACVTTTPQSGAVLGAIMARPGTVTTGGGTRANPHLSVAWKAQVEAMYAGTRLGRQELDGEVLPDAGALWTVELIERCRLLNPPQLAGEGDRSPSWASGGGGSVARVATGREPPPSAAEAAATSPSRGGFVRTLIAIDPPSGDGTCGIIACARDAAGVAHVLADHSVSARSPEGWARAVADAAALHGTNEVVAEGNQGGKMVAAVLLTADAGLRVRLVTATVGKTARAEPVAMMFEAGKARLHGRMPELEAQLLGMIAGGEYEGPGASPDRADAMVWGLGEVTRGRVEARVRGF